MTTVWNRKAGTLTYRLVGFDPETDRLVFEQSIREDLVRVVKKTAGIGFPFFDFAGDRPLSHDQAMHIAEIIGAKIDSRLAFFLTPIAKGGAYRVAHA